MTPSARRLTGYAPDPHKPLLPLAWQDWVGYGFAAISLFIAAGGGIGGGGILVPLYILLLGAQPLTLMPSVSIVPQRRSTALHAEAT